MKNAKKISVVIPVYGCKGALVELCERLEKSLKKITDSYEIILVNDACPQGSWEVIEEICKTNKRIKGVELSRNFGQMKAILAGMDLATGDYIVVMDCDLQDRPEEIGNLYKKLNEGYDVVFAKRVSRKDKKRKILAAKLFYKFYSMAVGHKYDPELCNFSIMRRNVAEAYCNMREEHRAFVMYIQWLGFKQAVLPVEHAERKEGKSSYSMRRRIKLAIEILLSQSDKFLKFIAVFGLIMSFIAFIATIAVIITHLFINPQLSGWVSTICAICLMGGLNIFVVGVTGLYIGKIFTQVKERPLYVVRTVLNKEEKK